MRYLVSGEQMKQMDRYTIKEVGIPSMVLQERAAMAVVREVETCAVKTGGRRDRIWVACGLGNNGADGIAAARMLFLKGYQVMILLCGSGAENDGTAEYRQQLKIARVLGVPVEEASDFIPGTCDLLVDAVFGVGLSRKIEDGYADVIAMLKERHPRAVIAVDIPSGIHSDTGQVMGIALKADVTVTFGYEKLGTVLYPGKVFSGRVVVADIGFPEVSYRESLCGSQGERTEYVTYGPEDEALRPERAPYSNKGTYGKVLVAAGSKNMSGAAYLSALAAYRMGAGLVKILTVEENRAILQEQLPEAIIETYEPYGSWERKIEESLDWASVVVLGPGLGREPYVEKLVKEILVHAYVPIIMDADGLNVIADAPYLTQYFTENIIITPHLGEMSRLTGIPIEEIQGRLIDTAKDYSGRHGITCVLKDAVTVVAGRENQIYLNTSGCSAMAKAGAGDVLSGAIAGLLAQGAENWDGAVLGVYLHGAAGERCLSRYGAHGLLAGDIAEELGRADGSLQNRI